MPYAWLALRRSRLSARARAGSEKTRQVDLSDGHAGFDFLGCHLHQRMSGRRRAEAASRLLSPAMTRPAPGGAGPLACVSADVAATVSWGSPPRDRGGESGTRG